MTNDNGPIMHTNGDAPNGWRKRLASPSFALPVLTVLCAAMLFGVVGLGVWLMLDARREESRENRLALAQGETNERLLRDNEEVVAALRKVLDENATLIASLEAQIAALSAQVSALGGQPVRPPPAAPEPPSTRPRLRSEPGPPAAQPTPAPPTPPAPTEPPPPPPPPPGDPCPVPTVPLVGCPVDG